MIEHPPAHTFAWTSQPWGRALHSPEFARIAPHLFTTLDLTLRGPGAGAGWARLAEAMDVDPGRLVRVKQVHGVAVVVVRARMQPAPPGGGNLDADDNRPRADVVMTDDPRSAVAVQVADCVPLLLADRRTGAVAAVHGGWRGTAAGVARTAVAAMTAHFGTRPADIAAAIGPSIGACCYQVGQDVFDAFAAGFPHADPGAWFRRDDGARAPEGAPRYRLDVPAAVAAQLRAAGVDAANIASCGLCTACHPSLFPSYRRDRAGTGRIAGVIRPLVAGR